MSVEDAVPSPQDAEAPAAEADGVAAMTDEAGHDDVVSHTVVMDQADVEHLTVCRRGASGKAAPSSLLKLISVATGTRVELLKRSSGRRARKVQISSESVQAQRLAEQFLRIAIESRRGAVRVTPEDLDEHSSIIAIPKELVSSVLGKNGSFIQTVAEEIGVLILKADSRPLQSMHPWLEVGQPVLLWHGVAEGDGSNWDPGVVVEHLPRGSVNIRLDDGREQLVTDISRLRPLLDVGSLVEVRVDKTPEEFGGWKSGSVARLLKDGKGVVVSLRGKRRAEPGARIKVEFFNESALKGGERRTLRLREVKGEEATTLKEDKKEAGREEADEESEGEGEDDGPDAEEDLDIADKDGDAEHDLDDADYEVDAELDMELDAEDADQDADAKRAEDTDPPPGTEDPDDDKDDDKEDEDMDEEEDEATTREETTTQGDLGNARFTAREPRKQGDVNEEVVKFLILGPFVDRCHARLRFMSAVDKKRPGFYCVEEVGWDAPEGMDWGVELVRKKELQNLGRSFLRGQQTKRDKKLRETTKCLVEYLGSDVWICGESQSRTFCRDLLLALTKSRNNILKMPTQVLLDSSSRLHLPSEAVSWATGGSGNRKWLNAVEEDEGVIVLFSENDSLGSRKETETGAAPGVECDGAENADDDDATREENASAGAAEEERSEPEDDGASPTPSSASRSLVILSLSERSRLRAKVRLMKAVEAAFMGSFSDGLRESSSESEGVAIDVHKFDYSLKASSQIKNSLGVLQAASGCCMEILKTKILFCGSGVERERGRQYLRWLLQRCASRADYTLALPKNLVSIRTDVTVMHLKLEDRQLLDGDALGRIELASNTFVFVREQPVEEVLARGKSAKLLCGAHSFKVEVVEAPGDSTDASSAPPGSLRIRLCTRTDTLKETSDEETVPLVICGCDAGLLRTSGRGFAVQEVEDALAAAAKKPPKSTAEAASAASTSAAGPEKGRHRKKEAEASSAWAEAWDEWDEWGEWYDWEEEEYRPRRGRNRHTAGASWNYSSSVDLDWQGSGDWWHGYGYGDSLWPDEAHGSRNREDLAGRRPRRRDKHKDEWDASWANDWEEPWSSGYHRGERERHFRGDDRDAYFGRDFEKRSRRDDDTRNQGYRGDADNYRFGKSDRDSHYNARESRDDFGRPPLRAKKEDDTRYRDDGRQRVDEYRFDMGDKDMKTRSYPSEDDRTRFRNDMDGRSYFSSSAIRSEDTRPAEDVARYMKSDTDGQFQVDKGSGSIVGSGSGSYVGSTSLGSSGFTGASQKYASSSTYGGSTFGGSSQSAVSSGATGVYGTRPGLASSGVNGTYSDSYGDGRADTYGGSSGSGFGSSVGCYDAGRTDTYGGSSESGFGSAGCYEGCGNGGDGCYGAGSGCYRSERMAGTGMQNNGSTDSYSWEGYNSYTAGVATGDVGYSEDPAYNGSCSGYSNSYRAGGSVSNTYGVSVSGEASYIGSTSNFVSSQRFGNDGSIGSVGNRFGTSSGYDSGYSSRIAQGVATTQASSAAPQGLSLTSFSPLGSSRPWTNNYQPQDEQY